MQTLYIMQGVPGSGKSYLAQLIQHGFDESMCVIYSTDDFFFVNGEYKHDVNKLVEYHNLNIERSIQALTEGKSVIVDNTNVHAWECKEYVKFAHSKGIPVVFVRVNGDFQNTHGVPDHAVERMKRKLENLTLETVLNSKAPWER